MVIILVQFTLGQYNRRVSPKEEVTLDYAFFAHESFAGRPLGLVVNLHYEDSVSFSHFLEFSHISYFKFGL